MTDIPDLSPAVLLAAGAVIDLYDAALDVVGSWPGFAPGAIDVELLAHHAAVYALRDALERVGVLDREPTLDPAAVKRLSPRDRGVSPPIITDAGQ